MRVLPSSYDLFSSLLLSRDTAGQVFPVLLYLQLRGLQGIPLHCSKERDAGLGGFQVSRAGDKIRCKSFPGALHHQCLTSARAEPSYPCVRRGLLTVQALLPACGSSTNLLDSGGLLCQAKWEGSLGICTELSMRTGPGPAWGRNFSAAKAPQRHHQERKWLFTAARE